MGQVRRDGREFLPFQSLPTFQSFLPFPPYPPFPPLSLTPPRQTCHGRKTMPREQNGATGSWWADLSAVFDNTADGACATDPSGAIVLWNRAAEAIMGYRDEDVLGRRCCDVFAGRDGRGNRLCHSACLVRFQLQRGEQVQHLEMATLTKGGQHVWLDMSSLYVGASRGHQPGLVHLFRDVTVAHEVEALVRHRVSHGPPVARDAHIDTHGLTPREAEVLGLLRTGATTDAIASELGISRATVRNHLQNIFAKLGVHTRVEAVAHVNDTKRRRSLPR